MERHRDRDSTAQLTRAWPPPAGDERQQIRQTRAMLTQPEESVSSIARLLGVSRSTIYKPLPEIGGTQGQLMDLTDASARRPTAGIRTT